MHESIARGAFAGPIFKNTAEMEGVGKANIESDFSDPQRGVPKQVLRFRDTEVLNIAHRRGSHDFFENKMEACRRKVDVPRKVFAGERIGKMILQVFHDGRDTGKTLD